MNESDETVLAQSDLLQKFIMVNRICDQCCELALKQFLLNMQIPLMTDVSFNAAGYPIPIEDDPLEEYTSTKKAFAPVA